MALKPLNSVDGISVSAEEIDVIYANGDVSAVNLVVSGESNLGPVGNVIITGGTTGQLLTTDGAGNLSFTSVSVEQSPAPMPIVIDEGNTLTISANYQGLFGYPLTVDGTLVVDGILIDVNDNGNGTATSLIANIANVSISGGTSGYYLQTDGAGTLSWSAGGGGGSGSPGGSNTQVQFNDAGSFAGNTGFTFNKTTGTLSATYFSGAGNALSNIQGANVSGAVGTATTAGTVTTNAQPNITSVGTLTSLTATGNIQGDYFIGNGSQLTGLSVGFSWSIASSNATMTANQGYFVDTSAGAKTMTLPSSAVIGDTIRINDLAGTFGTNNLTVARNGGNIQGVAQDLVVSVNQSSFGLVYSNSTYGWKLLEF